MDMRLSIDGSSASREGLQTAACPTCNHDIKLSGRLLLGTEITCPACGDQLQVVQIEPVELDWLDDFNREYEERYDS